MLERMLGCGIKGTSPAFLVGQTLTATLETRMVVSQKVGNQPTSRPSNTTLGHITKPPTCVLVTQDHIDTGGVTICDEGHSFGE